MLCPLGTHLATEPKDLLSTMAQLGQQWVGQLLQQV